MKTKKPQIYLLRDVGNHALKIGYSTDVYQRIAQHKTSHPFLSLIAIFPAIEQRTEKQLHLYLNWYRLPGTTEWYSDEPAVRDRINEYFLKLGLIEKPLPI